MFVCEVNSLPALKQVPAPHLGCCSLTVQLLEDTSRHHHLWLRAGQGEGVQVQMATVQYSTWWPPIPAPPHCSQYPPAARPPAAAPGSPAPPPPALPE